MERHFTCTDCQHTWGVPFGTPRPNECPQCQGKNIHRSPEERGPRWRHGQEPNTHGCCHHHGRRGA